MFEQPANQVTAHPTAAVGRPHIEATQAQRPGNGRVGSQAADADHPAFDRGDKERLARPVEQGPPVDPLPLEALDDAVSLSFGVSAKLCEIERSRGSGERKSTLPIAAPAAPHSAAVFWPWPNLRSI